MIEIFFSFSEQTDQTDRKVYLRGVPRVGDIVSFSREGPEFTVKHVVWEAFRDRPYDVYVVLT